MAACECCRLWQSLSGLISMFVVDIPRIPNGYIKICTGFYRIYLFFCMFIYRYVTSQRHAVTQLVEALRYKSGGRGFDSRWCHWNSSLTSFRPHYGPGLTQPLTEMSTRNISWG